MSWTQKSHGRNCERRIRIIWWTGLASLVLGAVLFAAALAMPTNPVVLFVSGIIGLVVGLALHGGFALDRWIRQTLGLPPSPYVRDGPPAYRCHSCGYELQGVQGVSCPECGAVRPAPLDDHEAM